MPTPASGERRRVAQMRNEAVGVLAQLFPLAAAVGHRVRTLALVGLAAGIAILLLVLARWTPNETRAWAGLFILALLVAAPPTVLLMFSFALGEVADLPEKLRRYPGTTRDQFEELRAIAYQAQARERPAWRRLPGSAWRLASLVRSARDLLTPHATLLPLVSVPFLVATAVSALLVPVLLIAALLVGIAAAA
jgi:hypothetical protein